MRQVLQALNSSPAGDKALLDWVKDAMDLKAAVDEHAIVATIDPEGKISSVNDQFCSATGYQRGELVGQDHRLLDSGNHPKKFFGELWRTINSGVVWHGEIMIRTKDGTCSWLATTILPCLDQDEQPRQFVAISANITEQKRIKEQLEGKLRLQGLLADLSTRFLGLFAGETDEDVAAVQKQIVETLGLDRMTLWQFDDSHSSLMVTHCWQAPGAPSVPARFDMAANAPWAYSRILSGENSSFASIDDLPPQAARDAETFRQLGSRSSVTMPLVAHGNVFGALSFEALRSERRWSDEEVAELKLVAQTIGNVIGRQRAEEKADQLRRELAHTMRVASLGGLAEGLAHELHQPLAAILSNAQAARRFIAGSGIEPDELRAILDDIVRDDKRAGGVIHNLRAMVT